MKKGLIIFGFLLILSPCVYAGFSFPPDHLKIENFVFNDTGNMIMDLVSHHIGGTWVAYDETEALAPVQGIDNGWTRLHVFNWADFGNDVISAPMGDVIDYLGHDWYVAGMLRIDMDFSYVEDPCLHDPILHIAVCVSYFEFEICGYLYMIWTYQFDPINKVFLSGPTPQVRRVHGVDWGGTGIGDLSLVVEDDGETFIYWTEYVTPEEGPIQHRLMRKQIDDGFIDGNGASGIYPPINTGTSNYVKSQAVDATFDFGVNQTLIATGCPNNSVRTYRALNTTGSPMGYIGEILNAQIPTIDSYPWTPAADFAVAYEARNGDNRAGIRFARYTGTAFQTPVVMSNSSAGTKPTITCYTWGNNSTQWLPNTTETVSWNQGEVLLGRRTGDLIETDIVIAKSRGGHPSSTNGNERPQIATISPPPPANNNQPVELHGFYAIWANPEVSIYGKVTDNIPFRSLTENVNSHWKNFTDYGEPSSPFIQVSCPPFYIHLKGMPAMDFEYSNGAKKFYVNPWEPGDQVYHSDVLYTVSSINVDGIYNSLKVVYDADINDNGLYDDPILATHTTTGTYNPDTSTLWNFWEFFPDTVEDFLGFWIYNQANGWVDLQAGFDCSSDLNFDFIDWEANSASAPPASVEEPGESCECPYEVMCDEVLTRDDVPGITTDHVACISGPAFIGHWLVITIPDCYSVTFEIDNLQGSQGGIALYHSCDDFPGDPIETKCGYGVSVTYKNETGTAQTIYALINYHQCEDPVITVSCDDMGVTNDECCGATDMFSDYNPIPYDLASATKSPNLNQCSNTPANSRDVWFRIPPEMGVLSIYMTTNDASNSGFVVFTGSCSSLSYQDCSTELSPMDHYYEFPGVTFDELYIKVYGLSSHSGEISWWGK